MSTESTTLKFRESPKKAIFFALFLAPPILLADLIFPILNQGFAYNFAKISLVAKIVKIFNIKKSLILSISPESIDMGLVAISALIVLVAAYKAIYKITKCYVLDTVSLRWNHGILVRTEDNIDMGKITDYKAPRTILDSLLGLYNIRLISNDKSDPDYTIRDVDADMGRKIVEFARLESYDSYAGRKQSEDAKKERR